jgi:hypothetical protein
MGTAACSACCLAISTTEWLDRSRPPRPRDLETREDAMRHVVRILNMPELHCLLFLGWLVWLAL